MEEGLALYAEYPPVGPFGDAIPAAVARLEAELPVPWKDVVGAVLGERQTVGRVVQVAMGTVLPELMPEDRASMEGQALAAIQANVLCTATDHV